MQLAPAAGQTVEPFYSIAPLYHRSSKLVSASREGSIRLHWTLIRTPQVTGPQSNGQDK